MRTRTVFNVLSKMQYRSQMQAKTQRLKRTNWSQIDILRWRLEFLHWFKCYSFWSSTFLFASKIKCKRSKWRMSMRRSISLFISSIIWCRTKSRSMRKVGMKKRIGSSFWRTTRKTIRRRWTRRLRPSYRKMESVCRIRYTLELNSQLSTTSSREWMSRKWLITWIWEFLSCYQVMTWIGTR